MLLTAHVPISLPHLRRSVSMGWTGRLTAMVDVVVAADICPRGRGPTRARSTRRTCKPTRRLRLGQHRTTPPLSVGVEGHTVIMSDDDEQENQTVQGSPPAKPPPDTSWLQTEQVKENRPATPRYRSTGTGSGHG